MCPEPDVDPEPLVGVVLDEDGVVEAWPYRREGRVLNEIGTNGCGLLRRWYRGAGWELELSSSEDMVLSHAPRAW